MRVEVQWNRGEQWEVVVAALAQTVPNTYRITIQTGTHVSPESLDGLRVRVDGLEAIHATYLGSGGDDASRHFVVTIVAMFPGSIDGLTPNIPSSN